MNYKNPVINHVSALIDSYESMIKSNDITKLIELQDELSIYSYRLAEECAEGKYEYNRSYYIRKITHQRQVQSSINSGLAKSMSKANHMADISVQDLVDKEITNESISYRLDLLLRQVNKILDSLRQKISYLKKEYEASSN